MTLISCGVFDQMPRLRICLAGSGIAWLPGFLRRAEMIYRATRRDIPWVRKSPSEYVRRQVMVSTFGSEYDGANDFLPTLLAGQPDYADMICYGSGFPCWDTLRPAEVQRVLPDAWNERALTRNAERWFRWPGQLELGG
jgi:predicted TIM-barrel fold metal-dependent hydrolase